MGWMTEDGKHEGWVAALFADGAFSETTGPKGFQVNYGGTYVDRENWRSDAEVVGWVGVCTCGWKTAPWTRVTTPAEEDLAARRAFGDFVVVGGELVSDFDPADPPGPVRFDADHRAIDEITHAEWKRHIEPDRLLAEIAELTERRREIDDRLAAAVAKARAVKAPWEDIGRAAGVTRQSAHEKWSRTAQLD